MSRLMIPAGTKYRKRLGAFGALNKKRDESVLDFSTATECYNFELCSGALRDGYGVSQSPFVPIGAARYWQYRYYSDERGGYVDTFLYQLPSGALYLYDAASGESRLMSGVIYDKLTAINYRLNSKDVLLISATGRRLLVWDGSTLTECEDAPVISSMALHYERLFVTSSAEPTKVFFSDDLDPTNWTVSTDDGGFIELLDERGALTKVVSFGGYLYIFREHGISRVTAYADQRDFSVSDLYVSAGRIFPESIVKCGSVIMFLASDGLYIFDGYECRKTLRELDGLFGSKCACGAYFDGKYYLSCEMNFSDSEVVGCEAGEHDVNGLLVYDVSSGEHSISRGLDISFMNAVSVDGKDYLVARDSDGCGIIEKCGRRISQNLIKRWTGPYTDFGLADRTKAIREVYTDSRSQCELTVNADGRKRVRTVKAGARRVRMNVNCKKLSMTITAMFCGVDIKPPTLVYSCY